jgi:predicted  nucleic acid-binding Zn-ribbon protein
MTRSIDLYQLQETDSGIDAAQRRLEEIIAELEGGDDLSELDAQVSGLEEELLEARTVQRAADDAVEDQRAAVRVLEEKLYDGSVKIPKELRALEEDLQGHKRQLATLEDRSLTAMARLEQDQSALQAAQAERSARKQRHSERVAALESERDTLTAQLRALQAERERRVARVDPPDRALYERLRRARGGRAVAKVERGTCQGCRISLPTTIFQRARSGLKIVQCTSCERILYVV